MPLRALPSAGRPHRGSVQFEFLTFKLYNPGMARPVRRTVRDHLLRLARKFPVVTVTGPRQSGKTTLCRGAFPDLPYATLEDPDTRAHATRDPRGFLAGFPAGAVLDEVQRVPDLLSYLQGIVDAAPRRARFVLSGSQHFGLLGSVTQSLAGRTALLNLMPFDRGEMRRVRGAAALDLWETLFRGGYPAIHDRRASPGDWLAGYTATYLERDVRQVLNVGDLGAFQDFLRLCAGRAGQVLNLAALGADAGVSHTTARAWLTVLEAGFLVFRLRPLHRNLRKRITRAPKLAFWDSGLLCYLLGIRTPAELRIHSARGAVFECWVASEIAKHRLHRGIAADLHYFRDHRGTEVDAVLDTGTRIAAVESKSGATVPEDPIRVLRGFAATTAIDPRCPRAELFLVHGGEAAGTREGVRIVPWSAVDRIDWR